MFVVTLRGLRLGSSPSHLKFSWLSLQILRKVREKLCIVIFLGCHCLGTGSCSAATSESAFEFGLKHIVAPSFRILNVRLKVHVHADSAYIWVTVR